MRITPAVLAALAAALLAVAPAGCQVPVGSTSKELTSSQFDDVPVPDGFAIDATEGRSFAYVEGGSSAGSIRLGRLEYTGRGDITSILEWYAEEMPRSIHGWEAGVALETDPPSMMFQRGGERCLITVRPEGGAVRILVERNTGGAETSP